MAPTPTLLAPTVRTTSRSANRSRGCPLGDLLHFLGKPYVLDLLRVFHESPGAHRFVDLQRRLEISPNTLAARLHDLVDAGFLVRTAYNEIPPRVDYEATRKTRELDDIFDAMRLWSKRNDLSPSPAITVTAPMVSVGRAAPRAEGGAQLPAGSKRYV